jgi:hypothetical protein
MANLDPALRDRVVREVETLTDAFDGALANPTPEAIDRVREAADRLMRATARVLLEAGQAPDPP